VGLLAHFFVAAEDDAVRYDGGRSFPESHRAQYKSFTEIELGTLYMIAQGIFVDADTVYDFKVVGSENDGERLVTEVIPDLSSRLAAAQDETLKAWAKLWGATEELRIPGSELMPVLLDLRRLSRLAASEGKSLYLWNCV